MQRMTSGTDRPEFAEGPASEALRGHETDPPRHPHAIAGAGIVAAGLVDHLTGTVLSAAFLYLPAVAWLGWLLGRKAGVTAAFAAAFAGLLADWPLETATAGVIVATLWNAAAAAALFGAVGWLAGEIRANRDRLLHVANTDPLTGLHNRSSLLVALENELARAERFGGDTGLLCISVDGFKRVNGARGHAAGDSLLKQLAAELGELMRRTDVIARIGGDEFAVLLTNTGPEATQSVAQKVHETLNAWAAANGHAVGFSLGWANAPLAGMSAEQLLARATATLDDTKKSGTETAPSVGPLAGSTATA
jgi:diguanylate cyclase (GGDEF)-like protein